MGKEMVCADSALGVQAGEPESLMPPSHSVWPM